MVAVMLTSTTALAGARVSAPMRRRVSAPRAARVVVRAEQPEAPKTGADGTVFYGGKSYSDAEWKDALANGTVSMSEVANPSAPSTSAAKKAVGFGDLMAFSGPAPELINGRLAMIGVVAALGAEFATGETVLQQLKDEPTGILLTFVIFAAASLVPLLNQSRDEAFGPFNSAAERLNGRAAMIGFASLLAIEAVKGSALF